MVLRLVSPLQLNRHQDLDQVVKNLLKDLPRDHNDDVRVVIYLDGMSGFTTNKCVVVNDKSYPIDFMRPDDSQGKFSGWVGLSYSQGIYESATLPAAYGCLDVEMDSPTKISGFTHHTRIVENGFENFEVTVELLLTKLMSNPKNITIFVTWEGFRPVLLPGQKLLIELDRKRYPVVFLSAAEKVNRKQGDVQIAYDSN